MSRANAGVAKFPLNFRKSAQIRQRRPSYADAIDFHLGMHRNIMPHDTFHTPSTPAHEANTLVPGRSCWRVERARRVSVLIDGAEYFETLRRVLRQARHGIWIAGWDVDGRTPLRGEEHPDDGAPEELRPFLDHLASERPDLDIRILLWDYAPLYMFDREFAPTINLGWRSAANIDFRLDDTVPIGGSHHQKLVVVDGQIAFCGGIDLTLCRWDTSEHRADNPGRAKPDGSPYPPFHDAEFMIEGNAAAALADLYRLRWKYATGENPRGGRNPSLEWPARATVDFENVDIAVCRTLPPGEEGVDGVREIEESHVAAIRRATTLVYIENQYMTATRIREALEERLRDCPSLEIVLIGPRSNSGWLEHAAMSNGRAVFVSRLRQIAPDRVALFHPLSLDGKGGEVQIMVHAKLTVIDDEILRIGSANLNNRSMGFDSECDLVFEARDPAQRRRLSAIRDRFLSEHLGIEPSRIEGLREESGSWIEMIRHAEPAGRILRENPYRAPEIAPEILEPLLKSADPERTTDLHLIFSPPEFEASDWADEKSSGSRLALWATCIGIVLIVGAAAIAPSVAGFDVEQAEKMMGLIRELPWTPPLVIGIYLLLGTIGVPITLLIAATAAAFGSISGLIYGMTGSLGSALLGYAVGRFLGKTILGRFARGRAERIRRSLKKQGFLSIAGLRLIPVAPFAIINIAAGAARLRPVDFAVGTVFGMFPGIAVMCAIGSGITEILKNPSPRNVALLAAGFAAWVFLAFGLRLAITRLRGGKT